MASVNGVKMEQKNSHRSDVSLAASVHKDAVVPDEVDKLKRIINCVEECSSGELPRSVQQSLSGLDDLKAARWRNHYCADRRPPSASPVKPQSKLDLAARRDHTGDGAGRKSADGPVGIAEIGFVQHIEELGAIRETHLLGDAEILMGAEIPGPVSRGDDDVAAGVAPGIEGR